MADYAGANPPYELLKARGLKESRCTIRFGGKLLFDYCWLLCYIAGSAGYAFVEAKPSKLLA